MNKKLFFLCCILFSTVCKAQITSGKIVYERKTNLYKKFKDENVKDWIKEIYKNKIDYFELYFNDTTSVFKPQESDLKEYYGWATDKNTVYQNRNDNERLTIKEIWGEHVYVKDTLYKRQWKITDSKRNISGYNCRKAVWQVNDSTRIYAWYCDEVITSTGPESFFGLPGAILGLATEDGGVIYMAKSVEGGIKDNSVFAIPKTKKKIYTPSELRTQLERDYGKEKWGKAMIKSTFGYW